MATRLRKTHQDDVRKKIQVSQIINRLQNHIAGKVDLSQSQVSAAKVLLDKAISNAPTEISGPEGGPVETVIRWASES